ncbi:hypothetical protein RND81_08G182300 [Saponaria officinalis]|uniref:Arginine decarboxylase n=1 Tax=Saponaria officinalis TaxID=3572 RepID=A0AAW1J864_SAPOF
MALLSSISSLPFYYVNSGVIVSTTNRTRLRVYASDHAMDSAILEPKTAKDEPKIEKPPSIPNNDSTTTTTSSKTITSPLVTALKSAVEQNPATFQFPGHNRGHSAPKSLSQIIGLNPYIFDVSELDDLSSPQGPLLEAQREAAELFGASETCFLVGGTTVGVIAAIMGTCRPGDTVILPRNCHISAISGLVLSGAVPKYIIPKYDFDWEAATSVSPSEVEKAITELESEGRKPAAVFITSPTYHGICSNVKEITNLCHSRGIPLIVDEAHGAHFGFHPNLPISALQQGADLVIQSTHKVLLSLSQSSMLHMSGDLVDRENVCTCLRTLQSTSPSFLLLASLDASNAQLRENPSAVFDNAINLAIEAKTRLKKIPGITVLDSPFLQEFRALDPLRVNVKVSELGLTGYKATEFLYQHHRILPVLPGSSSITFLFTPGTCRDHVNRLVSGFKHLSSSFLRHQQHRHETARAGAGVEPFVDINMKLTPREAFFARKRKVEMKNALGKICGELICPYPPGIPVMIPGEIVTEKAMEMLLQAKVDGARVSGAFDPLLSSMLICDV